MTLTWPVVAAVLFAALLHASWNALIKSGSDKALDTALIHVMGCAVGAALLAVVGLPQRAAWPWLAASVVVHIGYYIALAGAYRHGDLGLTYPIMRGTGPLLVAFVLALSGGAIIDETLSLATWLGVAGISGGVLLVGPVALVAGRQPPARDAVRAAQRLHHRHLHDHRRHRRARKRQRAAVRGAALHDRRPALLPARDAPPRRGRAAGRLGPHAQALAGGADGHRRRRSAPTASRCGR